MTYTCPHCHKQHRLPVGVTPPPHAATHCKQCGKRFLLEEAGRGKGALQGSTVTVDQELSSVPVAARGILDTFPELQALSPEQFRLAEIFLPTVDSRHQTRQNRLVSKLLVATAPLLNGKLLQKDEQVHRIAAGIAYFPFEIPYANGLLTGPMNNYALLATNKRLLFINLDYHQAHPTRYIFQIPYINIARVSRGFYGSSLIVTDSDRTWDFTTVERGLAASMERFIREQMVLVENSESTRPALAQLCPLCYLPVELALNSCPHCHTPYKSAAIARKKSLLLPGTGNLYLANATLGIIEMLGYLLTWVMTIMLVIIGIPGGIFGGVMLVLAYHCLAAYMAGKMAAKGNLAADVFIKTPLA